MQGLTGKTGLTQKEAIFQIIKSALGAAFIEGMDVRPVVLKKNDYGRKKHNSPELDRIVEKIEAAIFDGSIPSERYSKEKSSDYGGRLRVKAYARRIA